ncbi:unnamed protein product, partial [marine sediment metagenome]
LNSDLCCCLEGRDKWILVFDDASSYEDIRAYLPRKGAGHIIITSRNPVWKHADRSIKPDVFSNAEAVDFLKGRTGLENQEEALDLALALECFPLALEQAASYINETRLSYLEYLKLFKEY